MGLARAFATWVGRMASRAVQTQCEFGYSDFDPHRCGLDEMKAKPDFDGEPCRNCENGRPRWMSKSERDGLKLAVAQGWRTPDGGRCPPDLYREALSRGVTPIEVLRLRGRERS